MKKIILPLLLIALLLTACGGRVGMAVVEHMDSEIYSDTAIDAAIDCAMTYFRTHFDDCTLLTIAYAGDDSAQEAQEWAEQYEADEAIVLISSFAVGPTGGDGSLNPNFVYENWQWILVRSNGGAWRHADHGY